ncbi:hypothetical protein R3P38DRAFT_92112 [Favolaschia claudopus]|uniref:Uncharacterized protein n=1 Tax=Favolaschia claudopus TaxID=2862362 RepID=A0AAW0D8C2_9AGAR
MSALMSGRRCLWLLTQDSVLSQLTQAMQLVLSMRKTLARCRRPEDRRQNKAIPTPLHPTRKLQHLLGSNRRNTFADPRRPIQTGRATPTKRIQHYLRVGSFQPTPRIPHAQLHHYPTLHGAPSPSFSLSLLGTRVAMKNQIIWRVPDPSIHSSAAQAAAEDETAAEFAFEKGADAAGEWVGVITRAELRAENH